MSMKITTIPSPSLPAKIEAQPPEQNPALKRMKQLNGRQLTEFYHNQIEMQVRLISGLIRAWKGDPKHADRIHQVAKDGAADLMRTNEAYLERRRETEQASHQVSDEFAKVNAEASKPISFAKIENPRAARWLKFPEAGPLKRCLQEHPEVQDVPYLQGKIHDIVTAFSLSKVEDRCEMRNRATSAAMTNIDMILLPLEKALFDCALRSTEERFLDDDRTGF